MSFDFVSYRRLLFQNALDEAIDMLDNKGPQAFKKPAHAIRKQLASYRSSRKWSITALPRKDFYHDRLVRNLYQLGIAASHGEPPPDLIAVRPWTKKILIYGTMLLLLSAGAYSLFHETPCPSFDGEKEIAIIVDKFGTVKQPFFQKIGFNKETLEKQIADQLRRKNIDVAIHPVRVTNTDLAKEKCDACRASMVIWGDVEYGDSVRAYLNHYLDHESYDSYILKHNIPGVEEHYKNVFKLQTSQWIGNIQCLIKLFQGLLAKERFVSSTGAAKAEAIKEAEIYFSGLSGCATDSVLKIFALHCKGWAEIKLDMVTQALATYNQILSIDSSNMLALNNSALLYQEQDNYLYAHTRYEKLLEKNDIPYVRLANAEALTKLNRKEEARKEIETVRESGDYKLKQDVYDRRIRTIPTSSVAPTTGVSELSPSLSLSTIATQVNSGQREAAISNLDRLATRLDTASFTQEDIQMISDLYKAAGANTKAARFDTRASTMGSAVQPQSSTISRAVRRIN